MSDDQSSGTPLSGAAEEQKAVAYLRRALVDLNETRWRLHEAESRLAEPIAIVGMGCRYPGGVQSPEELWELLAAGRDAVSELPGDRAWDIQQLPSAVPGNPAATHKGGFLEGVGDFDAEFFGIDETEARLMDPQQRLLLETTWEACEYGGIDPGALRGSDTGVFAGINVLSYGAWLLGAVPQSAEGYAMMGNSGSIGIRPAGARPEARGARDHRRYGLLVVIRGAAPRLPITAPVRVLDGARGGGDDPRCPLDVHRHRLADQPRAVSELRCRSFADGANGVVFSEGVGVVLLERLADARRLGHEVVGVVRGSAYNQDGVSNGLTAPNGLAHERVIRQALRNAGISAGQVDAVEAHGMGTALGDTIEAQALISTYGRDRAAGRPLWLGSMKSNLGHTQASGGVGGVIKMIMAMRHGLLPKTLHADVPSRLIDWSDDTVSLLVEPVPWLEHGEPRRGAVHSFGMSGTNVHIIIEEPTPPEVPAPADERLARLEGRSRTPVPWPISGRGEEALRRQARRLAQFLDARPELDIADIGHSLVARPSLSHRAVLVGASRGELLAELEKVAAGHPAAEVAVGPGEPGSGEDLASLAQAWAAGSAVEWEPVFAKLDARWVRLPTYAFERRRYWVDHSPVWAADGPIVQGRRQVEEALMAAPDAASLAGGAD